MDFGGFFLLLFFRVPAVLISLTVHELAHAWTARRLGDDTAYRMGRVTWNPMAHLDFFGTLMLFFGPFGWAKPVPVNPRNLLHPRRDMAWIALAGPLSNIALGFAAALIYKHLFLGNTDRFSALFFVYFIKINIGLSFFNLLPFPPLDGSNILRGFFSPTADAKYLSAMRPLPLVFLVLVSLEWAFNVPVFQSLLNPIFAPYMHLLLDLYGVKVLFLGA